MPRKPIALPAKSEQKPRYQLAPWQVRYSIWRAEEGDGLPKQVRVNAAQHFADEGRDPALGPIEITWNKVRTLEDRDDFKQIVQARRESGMRAAQELIATYAPEAVNAHMWGLRKAKEKEALNIIPAYTQHFLRVASPVPEAQRANVNVIIALSPARADLIDYERPVIEAEVVPMPEEEQHG